MDPIHLLWRALRSSVFLFLGGVFAIERGREDFFIGGYLMLETAEVSWNSLDIVFLAPLGGEAQPISCFPFQ